MDEILQIECRNGPLTREARWTLRFGSTTAYERARAAAGIHALTRRCLAALDMESFRRFLSEQHAWRDYLRSLA